ncbi:MAG: helix-turn-helix domain-containing protein [Prevotella sp.]|nr:helix-turn-helix domain-containing protein [Prevotella sp.]
MKDRIKQIMEAQKMTQQQFANYIGLSTASLSSIFNDRTRPTLNTVEAIRNKFPNININWLMFGDGTMFNDGDDTEVHQQQEEGGLDLFSQAAGQSESVLPVTRQLSPEIRTEVKYIERPQRRITEIRVYYDDLTYETFIPEKK